MKICLVGAAGQTDRQTWWSQQSLFSNLRGRVHSSKTTTGHTQQQDHYWTHTAARPLLDTHSSKTTTGHTEHCTFVQL